MTYEQDKEDCRTTRRSQKAMIAKGGAVDIVHLRCPCGRVVKLVHMYRCYVCRVWLCWTCAGYHFGYEKGSIR